MLAGLRAEMGEPQAARLARRRTYLKMNFR